MPTTPARGGSSWRSFASVLVAGLLVGGGQITRIAGDEAFDHGFPAYAELLGAHVAGDRVDYAALSVEERRRSRVVGALASVSRETFEGWTRDQRLAFWINAYNAFTLETVARHYPIQAAWSPWEAWPMLAPRNSVRRIEGMRDELRWRAAGRDVTLEAIEHDILSQFGEPRIHFALSDASVSAAPLRQEPYVGERLDVQLDAAAREFLAAEQGLRLDGKAIRVTSILDWHWEDFVEDYAGLTEARRPPKDRAIFGAIVRHGPPEAASLAVTGDVRLRFIGYDWTLNDLDR